VAERFVLWHPATVGLTFIFSQVFAVRTPGDARWCFHQFSLMRVRKALMSI
jgi:hypothetical protein